MSGTVYVVQDRVFFGIALLAVLGACASGGLCGEGYREVDGRCEFYCEEPCGAHQDCFETDSGGECQCVAGYAGDPCEWTGGLEDPEFVRPEAWIKRNGAIVEPLAAGLDQGEGIASFESTVVCNAGAVSQVVEMPPYDLADPFVVDMTFRNQQVTGVVVGYNRAFRLLATSSRNWHPERFCLGEAAYGGQVKFQVAAYEQSTACFQNPIGTFAVDRLEIAVARPNECPAPGTVLNGDANLDEGGWVFHEEFLQPGGPPEAGFAAGVGEGDSSAIRLYKPQDSQNVSGAHTQLSVPLPETMPSPGLRFWWRGSPGSGIQVEMGTFPGLRNEDRPLDSLFGDGTPQEAVYCFPPWTHGNVVDLSFELLGPAEQEVIIDSVEIFSVSDQGCGDSTELFDPSFDSFPSRWPGAAHGRTSSVEIIGDPVRVRTPDSGSLAMTYVDNQARVDFHTWVWIPPSEGDQFPALSFFSDVPADPGASVFWSFSGGTGPGPDCIPDGPNSCPPIQLSRSLPMGGGWQPNLPVCLPDEWSERWFRFRVAVRPSDAPLEVFEEPKSVLLDDFEVVLDPGCAPIE